MNAPYNRPRLCLSALVLAAGLTFSAGAQPITIESVQGTGVSPIGNGSSGQPKLSTNGLSLIFRTSASNFLDGSDGTNATRIIKRNRSTGTMTMLNDSGNSASPPLSGSVPMPGINQRPTYRGGPAAWTNDANSVIPFDPCPDTNNLSDIFVNSGVGPRTTNTGGVCGIAANGSCDNADVSRDGTLVAFDSASTTFVSGDTAIRDVFTVTATGTRTFARRSIAGNAIVGFTAGNGDSINPAVAVTANNIYTVFESVATNFVSGDTATRDIFYRNDPIGLSFGGGLSKISVSSAGVSGDGASFNPDISADGRYVVFSSDATNLVSGDTNGVRDVFIRDVQTNTTRRLSVNFAGTQGNAASDNPVISDDGTWVAFESTSSNLAADFVTTPARSHIYLCHVPTGSMFLVSFNQTALAEGNGGSFRPSISGDGLTVVFESDATNLAQGVTDNNGVRDIYAYTRPAIPAIDDCISPATLTLDIAPGGSTAGALPTANLPSLCAQTRNSPDVYFRFVAGCPGTYRFSTAGSDFDTTLVALSECGGTVLGCNDDSNSTLQSQLDVALTAGQSILVRVGGFQNRTGNYTLAASLITPGTNLNDLCQAAQVVTTGNTPLSNCYATNSGPDFATCVFLGTINDVWFSFTPSASGSYIIETLNNTFDTVMAVYNGASCPVSSATQIACNDDYNPPDRRSRVQVSLTPGQTVLVRVGGWNGARGVATLRITRPGCNIADVTEIGGTFQNPGNPDGQLTVDDVIAFVNAFSDGSGCPGTAPCNLADITEIGGTFQSPGTPDGQLTVDDLITFVNAFSEGC